MEEKGGNDEDNIGQPRDLSSAKLRAGVGASKEGRREGGWKGGREGGERVDEKKGERMTMW